MGILFEGFQQFSNQVTWYTEFLEENPLQLCKERLRDNQLVRSKHRPQHIGAKAPGSGCAYQDICVKKHLHDMREKTSSSVKNPRASAKGIILFLNSSNCWRRSWRRKASRAISLRFLPDRLLAFDSRLSRSLSNRIVKVAVFMYYNVRRPQSFVKLNWVSLRPATTPPAQAIRSQPLFSPFSFQATSFSDVLPYLKRPYNTGIAAVVYVLQRPVPCSRNRARISPDCFSGT
jgi:hypothetical protein